MSHLKDKIILKCLRCREQYNVLVDDFTRGDFRRCTKCGGEIDFSAFHEWIRQQNEKNRKMTENIQNMLEELRKRRSEKSN